MTEYRIFVDPEVAQRAVDELVARTIVYAVVMVAGALTGWGLRVLAHHFLGWSL